MKNQKNLIAIFGIIISVVSLVIVFRKVDIYLFWDILKEIKLIPFVLMMVLYLFGFLVRGIRWRIVLRPIKNISWKRTTAFITIGYMANNILPARLGEFVRAFVTGKKEGISKVAVFGSMVVERVFDGLILLGIFSATALLANFSPEYAGIIKKVGITGGIIFATALICILFARLKRSWVEEPVKKLTSFFPLKIKNKVDEVVKNLIDSTFFLKLDRSLLFFLFLSVGVWVSEGLMFLVALYALNLPISLVVAFFAVSFTSLGLAVPSAPAYVGLFQGLVLMVFSFFGLDSNSALAYSVINNIVMVVPTTILGLIFLNMYGESIWKLSEKEKL
ncbi:MAG: flippase-like domain-containing protein [Parcubacteria group bacterium]|nr:flippase-like domain-containing protein [Parcubacteria group bacterium]